MRLINRPLTEDLRAQLRNTPKQHSPFSSTWSATESLIDREVRAIYKNGTEVVLMMDVDESHIRIDGGVKANARPYSDNVALALETSNGPLIFPCGRFWKWQDNVRAIALGMEALRKIERYGIAPNAEQYRGWQALPPGTPMPAAKMTVEEAARLLRDEASADYSTNGIITNSVLAAGAFRDAAKRHHPDIGGDPEMFKKLVEARDLLSVRV